MRCCGGLSKSGGCNSQRVEDLLYDVRLGDDLRVEGNLMGCLGLRSDFRIWSYP